MQGLLRTKLFIPPTPHEAIPRQRLMDKLNAGLTGKLSLVNAPAGYGKTTLVTTWLTTLADTEVAWVSLDGNDNDLRRFFTYIIAALTEIAASFEPISDEYLHDQRVELPGNEIVTSILNQALVYSQSIILILDDYHEIEEPPIHEALSFWLENQPPNLHLVLTSRTEPPLPLARMRVRREVNEIDADSLRFSRAESADFLNRHMQLNLSVADIDQLDAITEGWVASLQLAALSLQDKDDPSAFIQTFKGDNRYIVDYLISEVLQRQPGYIRDFLLQTSILERLNVQLCNAVTGQVGSQHILETLDQQRLFVIPLDDRRHWYRYHHLFADCLQAELHRTLPTEVATYHERASHWWSSNGDMTEAVQHALAAENKTLAAELIADNARTILWAEGEAQRPWQWIQALPNSLVQKSPQLLITKAWLHQEIFLDRSHVVTELLDQADALLAMPDLQVSDSERASMATEMELARWNIERLRGNLDQALVHCNHALALIQQSNEPLLQAGVHHSLALTHHHLGNVDKSVEYSQEHFGPHVQDRPLTNARLISLAYRVDALRLNGRLEVADRTCRSIHQAFVGKQNEGSAMLFIGWGEVLREQNELAQAEEVLLPAIEAIQSQPSMEAVRQTGAITLARIYQAQGKGRAGLQLLRESLRGHSGTDIYSPSARVSAVEALLHLQQGNFSAAQQWADQSGLTPEDKPIYLHEIDYLVLARILINAGTIPAAQALLGKLEKATVDGGRVARLIEVKTLQALAFQGLGQQDSAIARLGEAIAMASPDRFMRIFLDEGNALIPLLKQIAGRGVAVDYIRTLLSHQRNDTQAKPSRIETDPTEVATSTATQQQLETLLLNPLTDRELATLRYLATDLSIPEIAEQMIVAPSTIRTYVKRIYGKLDVHNRMEAVNRARSLSLVR